jgi:hypothetical protein
MFCGEMVLLEWLLWPVTMLSSNQVLCIVNHTFECKHLLFIHQEIGRGPV